MKLLQSCFKNYGRDTQFAYKFIVIIHLLAIKLNATSIGNIQPFIVFNFA